MRHARDLYVNNDVPALRQNGVEPAWYAMIVRDARAAAADLHAVDARRAKFRGHTAKSRPRPSSAEGI